MDCLFCKIAAHEIPAEIKYEDDNFIVIPDIHPQAKVHLLIIPKKHIGSVNEIENKDSALMGKTFIIAHDLAKKYGIADSGYRLVINTNQDAGQTIQHLHTHMLGGNPLGPIV